MRLFVARAEPQGPHSLLSCGPTHQPQWADLSICGSGPQQDHVVVEQWPVLTVWNRSPAWVAAKTTWAAVRA